MELNQFIYGLISGVVATLVGFSFALGWDLWKEKKRQEHDTGKAITLLQHEVAGNMEILDGNRALLEQDTALGGQGQEAISRLILLRTQVWESTRLTGALGAVGTQFLNELETTYLRTLMLNERIQGRELYRMTNQAMDNYNRRRMLINGEVLDGVKQLRPCFQKHRDDLAEKLR